MKIFLGADHRGFGLKEEIKRWLTDSGHRVCDEGTFVADKACDYPDIAFRVASAVAAHPRSRGILVCMSGIGHSIAANKVRGAYAALCYNREAAVLSRQHNNANILILGARFVRASEMRRMIQAWLTTPFEGGRHARRTGKIRQWESRMLRPVCVEDIAEKKKGKSRRGRKENK